MDGDQGKITFFLLCGFKNKKNTCRNHCRQTGMCFLSFFFSNLLVFSVLTNYCAPHVSYVKLRKLRRGRKHGQDSAAAADRHRSQDSCGPGPARMAPLPCQPPCLGSESGILQDSLRRYAATNVTYIVHVTV